MCAVRLAAHEDSNKRRAALLQAEAIHVTCCKLEDKLEDVLELMSTGAVHRIWVVDDDRKPIGCVSLVDILALFQHWESPEQRELGSKKKKEEELTPQFEKTTESELKERVVATAPAGQADEQMQE